MITKQPSFLLRVLDALNSLEKAAEQGCSAKEITEYLCSNYKCDGNVHSTVQMQVQISLNRALEQGMVEKSGGNKYILVPSVVHFMKSCMPENVLRRRTIKGCEILKKAPNRNQLIRPLKVPSKKNSTRKLKKQPRRKHRRRMPKTSNRKEIVKKTGWVNSDYCRRLSCVCSSGNETKNKSKQTHNIGRKQKINKPVYNTLGMKQKELFAAALKKLRNGEIGTFTANRSVIKCPDCSRQIILQKLGVCLHCSRKFIIAKKDFNARV